MEKTKAAILKKSSQYKIAGSLWIECDGEKFFGPGRMELLLRIDEMGSINKAAKHMKMSYKKAWEMVDALNRQAAQPIVITQSGGERGGGSVLTPAARDLMKYHQYMRERFLKFLEKETQRLLKN